jgi:hypothetical protein
MSPDEQADRGENNTDFDQGDLNCAFLLKIPNKEDNIQTRTPVIHDFAYYLFSIKLSKTPVSFSGKLNF